MIGAEEADAVVEAIFPQTEVATKADVNDLRVEIEKLRGEMASGFAAQTRWLTGFMVAWSGVVLAAVKLLM